MKQYLFAEDGNVAAGVLVVLVGVKRTAFNADEMVASANFAGVNLVGGSVIGHFLEHVRRDVLVRQILYTTRVNLSSTRLLYRFNWNVYLENLLGALRDVARPRENKRQRTNRFWQHANSDFEASVTYRLASHPRISVVVRRPNVLITIEFYFEILKVKSSK